MLLHHGERAEDTDLCTLGAMRASGVTRVIDLRKGGAGGTSVFLLSLLGPLCMLRELCAGRWGSHWLNWVSCLVGVVHVQVVIKLLAPVMGWGG